MSYMLGKPLEWVSCLRKNNSPVLNNYEEFIKELKTNFGDYTSEAVVANSKLCNIRQKKMGHVFEYISEFQRIAQYSNFNENAKIHMFIKGLKQPLREKLAMVDPNPTSLAKLSTTILNIESLTRRNENIEYYNRYDGKNDPMEVDLYRIKRGPNDIKYTSRTKNYVETKNDHSNERKQDICYYCKQRGHRSFNCPNKIKPKNLRILRKGKEIEDNTTNLRRIKRVDNLKELPMLREISCIERFKPKSNIMEFYIKTNDTEENKVSLLIDSGSDLNFIHPDTAKKLGINTQTIDKPFRVSGLGYGLPIVNRETEKCILRFKNHLEIIKLYVLRIPDVDIILGLPWINKHSPCNYHDANKISFSSGYCARNCNNGKRKRKNKKKTSIKNKLTTLEKELKKEKEENNGEGLSCSSKPIRYPWDSDIDEESEPEPYFKGRVVRTINDDPDSDSDREDNFMFDSISKNEFENDLISDSNSVSNNLNDSCNKTNSCNNSKSCNCQDM